MNSNSIEALQLGQVRGILTMRDEEATGWAVVFCFLAGGGLSGSAAFPFSFPFSFPFPFPLAVSFRERSSTAVARDAGSGVCAGRVGFGCQKFGKVRKGSKLVREA